MQPRRHVGDHEGNRAVHFSLAHQLVVVQYEHDLAVERREIVEQQG